MSAATFAGPPSVFEECAAATRPMRRSPRMCRECLPRRCDLDLGAWTRSSCPHPGRRHCLQPAINLAAQLGVLLVVLCSKQTRAEQVAERVSTSPGARALVVEIPEDWSHPKFPTRTSSQAFREANADRASDLSAKRNIGLLLARLHGWNKIVFVDDDVTLSRTDNVARLAGQLDSYQVAGMIVRDFQTTLWFAMHVGTRGCRRTSF